MSLKTHVTNRGYQKTDKNGKGDIVRRKIRWRLKRITAQAPAARKMDAPVLAAAKVGVQVRAARKADAQDPVVRNEVKFKADNVTTLRWK
jgi:hypothetical protein